jgi:hypothetical protein
MMNRAYLAIPAALLMASILASCAVTQNTTTVTHKLEADANVPFKKVLVVALFDSFDARRYFETEVVNAMKGTGAEGIRSTSMMNTKTPLVPQTFLDMIDEIGADALILTQLTTHDAETKEKDARPRATYNYWPTYYYNVWEVQLTEYVEPPRMSTEHDLVLATQVFSVAKHEPVWGMESNSKFTEVQEDGLDYNVFVEEGTLIVNHLKSDKLISR